MDAAPRDQQHLADRVAVALSAQGNALSGWLGEQRWFGDKGRTIVSTRAVGAAELGGDPPTFWAAVDFAFDDGSARYALPLTLGAAGDSVLATLPDGPLTDATTDPTVGALLLDLLTTGARIPCGPGMLVFEPFAGLPGLVDRARSGSVVSGGLEQTNTAIRYGTVLLLKLFRTLQPGVNPDEEIGRHLATSGFRHVPAPLGAIRFFDGTGSAELAGFAQAFVPNHGDGWTWLLDRLRPLAQGEVSDADEIAAAIATLGRTTAELHVALASGPVDAAFSPAPAAGEEISVLHRLAEAHLDETLSALRDRRAGLGAENRQRVDRVLATERSLARVLAGFGEEAGLARIRVHGDYHLGQVLRSVEGGWTIIDFEGEPARPLDERRRKTSPLKDVAGMLRLFAYARGALAGEQVAAQGGALLAEWERAARASFLAAYRTEAASSPTPLVPTDDAAFGLALAAWELDKALYEVRYELANRPDWLSIPLATLLPTDA